MHHPRRKDVFNRSGKRWLLLLGDGVLAGAFASFALNHYTGVGSNTVSWLAAFAAALAVELLDRRLGVRDTRSKSGSGA